MNDFYDLWASQVPYVEFDKIDVAAAMRTMIFAGHWRNRCELAAAVPPVRTVMHAEVAWPAAARLRSVQCAVRGALGGAFASGAEVTADAIRTAPGAAAFAASSDVACDATVTP